MRFQVLAIVNDAITASSIPIRIWRKGAGSLKAKIESINDIQDIGISEYGTRRRFSGKPGKKRIIKTMQATWVSVHQGTSNVYYAMQLGLTPLGTMAHEYLQACQALGPRLRDSQKYAFEMWAKEYRGDLGIALSDVYGMKPFLLDFDMYFCKLFDGARHDSGDPFEWGEHLIEHYRKNRCDRKQRH